MLGTDLGMDCFNFDWFELIKFTGILKNWNWYNSMLRNPTDFGGRVTSILIGLNWINSLAFFKLEIEMIQCLINDLRMDWFNYDVIETARFQSKIWVNESQKSFSFTFPPPLPPPPPPPPPPLLLLLVTGMKCWNVETRVFSCCFSPSGRLNILPRAPT